MSVVVKFRGLASATYTPTKFQGSTLDDDEIEYPHLDRLDGTRCEFDFLDGFDYRDDADKEDKILVGIGLKDGYMEFICEKHLYPSGVISNELYTITKYTSPRFLTDEELHVLALYTRGQWSDGAGEGFEQEPIYVDDDEVYISPWNHEQVITITQEYVQE